MSPWTSFQLLFLILGCTVRYTHQLVEDVTRPNCNSPTQYYNQNAKKCCDRCPPGEYDKEECRSHTQTRCEVCRIGTYTDSWNHMKKCRQCLPCVLDFIVTVNCSTSQATVCECQEGYVCDYTVNQRCQSCRLSAIRSAPRAERTTDIAPTDEVEVEDEDKASIVSDPYIWITILILGIILVLLTVFICIKSSIGKKIAHEFRMSGARSPINREAENGGGQTTGFQRTPLLQTPVNHAAVGPPYKKVSPSMCIQQPGSQTHQCRDVEHIGIPQEATTHPFQEGGGTDKCCTAIGDNDFKIDIIVGNICYCHQNAMVLQQAKRHGTHTPVKEEGADLPYPVEESQQSKCSSMTLNPPGSICTFAPAESSSRLHSSSSSEALS